MADVADGLRFFFFLNPMFLSVTKADCGECCRSSCGSKYTVGKHPIFGRVLDGAR